MRLGGLKREKVTEKHDRFNPHHFWRGLLLFGVLLLTIVFLYFLYFFWQVNVALDAPVVPETNQNSSKIKLLKQDLEKIEQVIQAKETRGNGVFLDPLNR